MISSNRNHHFQIQCIVIDYIVNNDMLSISGATLVLGIQNLRRLHYSSRSADKPLNPQPFIQKSVANIFGSVTFGERMDYEDTIFIKYTQIFNRSIQIVGNSGVINTFPFVR